MTRPNNNHKKQVDMKTYEKPMLEVVVIDTRCAVCMSTYSSEGGPEQFSKSFDFDDYSQEEEEE